MTNIDLQDLTPTVTNIDLQDLTPTVTPTEIHVWRVSLGATRSEMEALRHCLSKGEVERLERFTSAVVRDRRAVAWGRLRVILARYLDCLPQDIQIAREGLGRPEIIYPEAARLFFSLSHSGNFGLVTISMAAVGVDIERIDLDVDTERLAMRFFTSREAEYLGSLPEGERVRAFFRLWVLKEAVLKSCGETVPAGLSKCELALAPEGPRLCSSNFKSMTDACALTEIPVSAGYVAAVAGGKESAHVSVCDF